MSRVRAIIAVAFACALALFIGTMPYAPSSARASAPPQDRDAIPHWECDPDSCWVTGIDCPPICATGFCCNIKQE